MSDEMDLRETLNETMAKIGACQLESATAELAAITLFTVLRKEHNSLIGLLTGVKKICLDMETEIERLATENESLKKQLFEALGPSRTGDKA